MTPTKKDLSIKQLLTMGGALFSMHFGASCMLYPVDWGKNSGTSVFIAYIAIVLTALLLPLLAYVALARGKGNFAAITAKISPRFGSVFCTITVLVMGPLYVVPRMSAAAWDAILQLTGLQLPGFLPIFLFNCLFYALTYWFLADRSDTVDKIGKILFPVLLLIVVLVIGKGLLTPISTDWQPKTYPESALAYGLLQGYQTGDLPAALMFGLIVIQGIQKAGISESRTNRNLVRIGLVGMGMLAITHLGHMVVGAGTGGTIDLSLSALYCEVVLQLWGKTGGIFFNVALVLAALTTAVGLCGSAGEFFSETAKGRISYKKISLIMVCISTLVSSVGLNNIVKFIGPLLDACYPTAIVVVLYYVLCPRLENPRLLLGARFAMIAAAVTGCVDVLSSYNALLGINNALFESFYRALPLSQFRLTWIPVSVVVFLLGILLYRPKNK
ncbi:MAG: branched-chain amino acid transport system II carrier protein [Oscillospiraceae bacterium]|nr:branched-chain amino acid transport system II carrier protein [Oscillospiraceae bacterium]MBQ7330144.1 branched-chain amino acid transport system II carrier protein [Oscillospiraceae bacterium]